MNNLILIGVDIDEKWRLIICRDDGGGFWIGLKYSLEWWQKMHVGTFWWEKI